MSFSYFSQTPLFLVPELFFGLCLVIFLCLGLFFSAVVSNWKVQNLNILSFSNDFLQLGIFVSIFTIGLFTLNQVETVLFDNHFVQNFFLTNNKTILLFLLISTFCLSLDYYKYEGLDLFEYPLLKMLALFMTFFVISSNSFIAFYMALEAQSLILYILAAFARKNELSTEAGIKYFILGVLASGMLLLGIVLIYMSYGTFMFEDIAILNHHLIVKPVLVELGSVLIVSALMFKLGAAPFHVWIPDVYEGSPLPSTIFFATAIKFTTLIILIRLFTTIFMQVDASYYVVFLCAFTSLFVGSIGTLRQTKLKRFVAYSGIVHVGFMLLCLCSLESAYALQAFFFYILLYMITTVGFFGIVGSMRPLSDCSYRSIYFIEFSHLAQKNLLLSVSGMIFIASMAGIPPLSGFFAKFYVLFATVDSRNFFLAMVALILSVLSMFYYLRIIRIMWFDPSLTNWISYRPPERLCSLLISISVFIIVAYFFEPAILTELFFIMFKTI
jgi:NADH-quinone oxidoreductase subunit N